MKYIIIDDNDAFAKMLSRQLLKRVDENGKPEPCKDEEVQFQEDVADVTTSQIAETIIKKKLPEDVIIFININLKTKEGNRQDQKGIEMLIWLRIKGLLKHVVLYSFETLYTVLNREPKHLIATSKGTTFVQLPYDFKKLHEILDKKKRDEKLLADKENVKAVLKPATNLESIRHQEANWWGVKALWDMHNIVTEGNISIPYPTFITEKLLTIENAIIDYVYIDDILSVKKYVNCLSASIENEVEKLNTNLSRFNLNVGDKVIEMEIIDEEEYLTKKEIENNKPFLDFYANTTKEYNEVKLVIQDLNEKLSKTKNEKSKVDKEVSYFKNEIASLNNQLKKLAIKLSNLNKAAKNELFKKEIPHIKSPTKILFIDDNASKGWLDIFKLMLPAATIQELIPDENAPDIDTLYNEILSIIQSFEPDLIMLDLRLFNETDRSIEIENVSGLQILKKIRTSFLGIPILITTASNKVWSYQNLLKLGADAYWIKEGVDNDFDANRSSQNYYRILWLIQKMTSPDYIVVREMDLLIKHISIEKNQWWNVLNNEKWENNVSIESDSQEILKVLQSSIELTKIYLHSFSLGHSYRNNIYNGFYLSSLINKLGVIVEIIHNITEQDYKEKLNIVELLQRRGDIRGLEIRSKRNTASHREYRSISWDYYQHFWKDVKLYLEKSPNTP